MTKNIFITPKLEFNKYKKIEIILDKDWFSYLNSINYRGFTGYFDKISEINYISQYFDGLIISGGGDIYKNKKDKLNKLRDNFEIKLINSFLKNKKPILCICRGFQLYANYLGNNIFKKNKNHVKIQHTIYSVKQNSVLKFKKLNTNSFHNYSIQKTSNKLENFFISKDGSIEISKLKSKNLFCFMFHPERKNKDQKKINLILRKIFK